jgi:hypothetical protein
MRTLLPGRLPTAAALAFAALAAGGLAAASTSARPTLRLLRMAPARVGGTDFKAGERVRVVFQRRSTYARRIVYASGRGTFVASFDVAVRSRCLSFRVAAVGSAGSRAVLKFVPRPACMPARHGRARS